MEWIGDPPDHATQTCEIRLKGESLPDVSTIGQFVASLKVGATLRAAEIRVVGQLSRTGDAIRFHLPKGESVGLAALTRKVQWNHAKKRAHPPSRAEKTAYARLISNRSTAKSRLEICGPLRVIAGKPSVLEVREFKWMD